MLSRKIVLLVAVIASGVFAVIMVNVMLPSSSPPPQTEEAKHPVFKIRVAVSALPVGTIIQSSDLDWKETDQKPDKNQFDQNHNDEDPLIGAIVRKSLASGQVIERTDVVFPGSPDFLAAALSPGKRAVTLPINDVSGNAGLIMPGDHVDILLIQHFSDNGPARPKDVVGETILTNVRVIAVGKIFAENKDLDKDIKQASNVAARTVTFEVDPDQAQRIVVANQIGDLALALRSLAVNTSNPADLSGHEGNERPNPVTSFDISETLGARAVTAPTSTIPENLPKIYRGSQAQ